MQTCTKCKVTKSLSEFKNKKDQKKPAARCKSCDSLATKAYFFKTTVEELLLFMDIHNHQCGICGISEKEARTLNNKTTHYGLYIDHCHNTNNLRGLLCHNCNLIIGHAKDDTSILNNAIKYLT